MGYDDRQGRERWRGDDGGRDDERGFFEKAGDEVRSWFGSDEDDRGRRDQARGWRRDEDRGPGWRGDDSFGGGFGNQRPRSQSLGDRGRDLEDDRAPERYGGSFEKGYGSGGGDPGMGVGGRDFYAGPGHDSEFGGPRFDRADAGSTGTHGVHPVASSSGLASQGYGTSAAGYSSSARRYAMMDRGNERRERSGGMHDPHYSEWRRRQIEQLDRDYDDYCRENQSRFEQEFGSWREQRRSTLSKVRDHMKVVGADGSPVGTVDRVVGDRIVLTKSDPDAGGMHHSIPCSWIDNVEEEVRLNRTAEEAMREWRGEEENGAMFRTPREHEGRGAHNLDRSFSGTY